MKTKAIKYLNGLVRDDTIKSEIDLIEWIKRAVREVKEEKDEQPKVDLGFYFERLWKHYPRKVAKQGAKKTFEKLFKGLNEEQVREKANKVWLLQKRYVQECIDTNRDMCYIAHYQSWLNANVPKG